MNEITKTGVIKVYLVQHPAGDTWLVSKYSRQNLPLPDHWKILAETEIVVTLIGDAGYDADRAYPEGR